MFFKYHDFVSIRTPVVENINISVKQIFDNPFSVRKKSEIKIPVASVIKTIELNLGTIFFYTLIYLSRQSAGCTFEILFRVGFFQNPTDATGWVGGRRCSKLLRASC